jgi:hypothetical protein
LKTVVNCPLRSFFSSIAVKKIDKKHTSLLSYFLTSLLRQKMNLGLLKIAAPL